MVDTQSFLDGSFVDLTGAEIRVLAPPSIVANVSFTATFLGVRSSGELISAFNRSIAVTAVGTGTLTVVSGCTWKRGQCDMVLIYSRSLQPGQSETFAISAADKSNGSIKGLSGNIVATGLVQLTTFTFTAPASTISNQDFQITIKAMGNDGNLFSSFTGNVNLTSAGNSTGSLTKTTAGPFVGGQYTLTLQYTQPTSSLIITATDAAGLGASGSSLGIKVGFDSFGVIAVPFDQDKIRLSWQEPSTTNNYKIYQFINASSGFVQVGSGTAPLSAYVVTGLTASTQYRLKVEARNAGGTVLASGEAIASTTAVAGGCTTNVSADVTVDTTWTAAGSPYCISATRNVASPAKLTIQPGAIIRVSGGSAIMLNIQSGAQLFADGSSSAPVIFTSNAAAPAYNDWGGITLAAGATATTFSGDDYFSGSRIRFVVLEYATRAIALNIPQSIEYVLLRHIKTGSGSSYSGVWTNGNRAVIRYSYFFDTYSLNANGGVIGIQGATSTVVAYNTFNTVGVIGANSGGAIELLSTPTTPQVTGNTFMNVSANTGGAIQVGPATSATISNNFFNTASSTTDGGAIYLGISAASTTVTKNTFSGASAGGNGGCVYVQNGNSGSIISYNNFSACSATTSGAAIYVGGTTTANLTVQQNNFTSASTVLYRNLEDTTGGYIVDKNWWGQVVAGGACDALPVLVCTTTAAGVPAITNNQSASWPLCSASPSDANCVGAQ